MTYQNAHLQSSTVAWSLKDNGTLLCRKAYIVTFSPYATVDTYLLRFRWPIKYTSNVLRKVCTAHSSLQGLVCKLVAVEHGRPIFPWGNSTRTLKTGRPGPAVAPKIIHKPARITFVQLLPRSSFAKWEFSNLNSRPTGLASLCIVNTLLSASYVPSLTENRTSSSSIMQKCSGNRPCTCRSNENEDQQPPPHGRMRTDHQGSAISRARSTWPKLMCPQSFICAAFCGWDSPFTITASSIAPSHVHLGLAEKKSGGLQKAWLVALLKRALMIESKKHSSRRRSTVSSCPTHQARPNVYCRMLEPWPQHESLNHQNYRNSLANK